MKEVKEICDRMLADPAPAMTSADDLLRHARRGRARHRAWLGTGFAAAATLAIAAAAPLLTATAPDGRPPVNQAVAPTSAAPISGAVTDLLPAGADVYLDSRTDAGAFGYIVSNTAPPGDLCQAPLPLRSKIEITPGPCEIVTIEGVQARLGSFRRTDAEPPGKDGAQSPWTTGAQSQGMNFALCYANGKAYLTMQPWDPSTPPSSTAVAQYLAQALLRFR